MDTKVLAAAVAGFLLGGLTVSVAAELDDGSDSSHHGAAVPGPAVVRAS